ncbi:hypothetical protein QYE76_039362 [Lolium multiflorum]|uniref:Dirigent protein n=1 Tax=Lolium multiflorum TaxID=4521 RepID=A0AAD8WS36_LOLMU|nr:hypothetical protein QYE76_039362 [Lolium multiflorum]
MLHLRRAFRGVWWSPAAARPRPAATPPLAGCPHAQSPLPSPRIDVRGHHSAAPARVASVCAWSRHAGSSSPTSCTPPRLHPVAAGLANHFRLRWLADHRNSHLGVQHDHPRAAPRPRRLRLDRLGIDTLSTTLDASPSLSSHYALAHAATSTPAPDHDIHGTFARLPTKPATPTLSALDIGIKGLTSRDTSSLQSKPRSIFQAVSDRPGRGISARHGGFRPRPGEARLQQLQRAVQEDDTLLPRHPLRRRQQHGERHVVGDHDPTALSTSRSKNTTYFGMLAVFNDPMTAGKALPVAGEEPAAHAEGFYFYDKQEAQSAWFGFSIVFNSTAHKGTINLMGADIMSQKTRDISVVGGTGDFFMARGIATLSTDALEGLHYFRLRMDIKLYECYV